MSALADVQLHYVDDVDGAVALMSWLGERRTTPLAVDTETEGLNPLKDKVRLVQFGDAMQGWTVPWERWSGLVEEVFNRYEGEYVFHNMRFDHWMLEQQCGIELPKHRIHDTMVQAHVLDASRQVDLKGISTELIDGQAAVGQAMLEHAMTQGGWTWATIPLTVQAYSVYAAMDTVLTARLHEKLYPQVMADCPHAYDLERAFTWVVLKMEKRGARVDRDFTQRKLDEFSAYVESIEGWCQSHYGFAPGSDLKVIEVLQRDTGYPFTKMTPGGRPSLDADVLEGIIAVTQHPLAEAVLGRRRVQKLASTYLKNFLGFADENDIIRPSMKAIGARTGRMSISDPALQTLPRRDDDNPLAITVRNCIVPREGNVLLMCDFDQIEMRLMAHLSNDEGLRQAFQVGDFFTNIARELYGDPNLEKKDPRRQMTKNGMYALGYGAGAEKIALTTGNTLEVVQEFLDGLGVRFPGIKRLQRQVASEAEQRLRTEGRGYTRSPLTHRRHWGDDYKLYALVNYLIQGTAAEVLKYKACELDAAGVGDYMTLLVHDETILDLPLEDVEEVTATVNAIMNDSTMFSLPLTAGTDFGFRWGEKGEVKLEQLIELRDQKLEETAA